MKKRTSVQLLAFLSLFTLLFLCASLPLLNAEPAQVFVQRDDQQTPQHDPDTTAEPTTDNQAEPTSVRSRCL